MQTLSRKEFFTLPMESIILKAIRPDRKEITMTPAIILFAATYVLMLTFSKYRPWFALASGAAFVALGMLPAGEILPSLDFNVLLMIGGTMGLVQLFIDSRMPERMADMIMDRVPNVQIAAVALSLFSGIISAFVDNVATVLMVAPVVARRMLFVR